MLFTNEQVQEQKQRFESLMQSVNLCKVGEKYFYFEGHDNGDGKYNSYYYLLRVLRLLANVGGCYYYPGTNSFYIEIIRREALSAYLKSLQK